MTPLALLPDLLSNLPLLAISLIKRMSLSLLHEVTDLRKGENRKHFYKSFKTWRQKVKKSSVKCKYEKEIHFPVFFHRSLPFSGYFLSSDLTFSTNVKNDALTLGTELEKRDNKSRTRIFTLNKQTFSSQSCHVSKCGFPLGEINGHFTVKFISVCAILFVYSLADEIFLFNIVKMDLTNSRRKNSRKLLDQSKQKYISIFALSANTFQSDQIEDGC